MATYDITTGTVPSNLKPGDIIVCPYSGEIKELTLYAGQYQIECWGARGSSYSDTTGLGGYGGYTVGTYTPISATTLYLVSGGRPYNGGGLCYSGEEGRATGGGATHIATQTGLLSTLSAATSSIIAVAGGGGSGVRLSVLGSKASSGGLGGGLTGGNGEGSSTTYVGTGGTQTSGGYGYKTSCAGSFGQGGTGYDDYDSGTPHAGPGGGGGYYGGGGGSSRMKSYTIYVGGGGGGSGYVSSVLTNASTSTQTTSTNPDTTNYYGYIKITVISVPTTSKEIYYKTNSSWIQCDDLLLKQSSSWFSSGDVLTKVNGSWYDI